MEFVRNLAHKFLEMTHGRTTAFFVLFFIAGNVLQWIGKMTPTYVYFMGTLGGLVLLHSVKEDVLVGKDPPPPPGGPDVDVTK